MNLLHIYIIIFSSIFELNYSNEKHGLFNLTVTDVDLCRGPKLKECSVLKAQLTSRNVILYDLNVTQNVSPAKGRVVGITNGKEYLRLHMKRPCDHIFLKPMFYYNFNITKDCVVLKGQYQYSVDVLKITQSFIGRSSLLGNWTFKTVLYDDKCNFICVNLKVHMF